MNASQNVTRNTNLDRLDRVLNDRIGRARDDGEIRAAWKQKVAIKRTLALLPADDVESHAARYVAELMTAAA
jgi:hypothetical protein